MRNLHAHALRSLNAIQLLLSAKLERLVVNVNSWHDAIRLQLIAESEDARKQIQ